jgi:hypothetical protein
VAGPFAWTQGALTAAGWLDWLQHLPLALETILSDGMRFLGVHASPSRGDGLGISLAISDETIQGGRKGVKRTSFVLATRLGPGIGALGRGMWSISGV